MITAENMLRVAIVSSVDKPKLKARVYFPDQKDMVSDWLYVIQQKPQYTKTDGNHSQPDAGYGGAHKHELDNWMPDINAKVLVIYPCGIDKDGYILGVIP